MSTAPASRRHFMGNAFVRSTACGRFVEGTRASDPVWTSDRDAVTCDRCKAVL